jgi:hypothetical protein
MATKVTRKTPMSFPKPSILMIRYDSSHLPLLNTCQVQRIFFFERGKAGDIEVENEVDLSRKGTRLCVLADCLKLAGDFDGMLETNLECF